MIARPQKKHIKTKTRTHTHTHTHTHTRTQQKTQSNTHKNNNDNNNKNNNHKKLLKAKMNKHRTKKQHTVIQKTHQTTKITRNEI